MENAERVYRTIRESGILPTAFIYDGQMARPLAGTLWESGIPLVEILQRTPEAAGAVAVMKEAYPGLLVGAGTVLDLETAREMKRRGADFIVLPNYQPDVAEWCLEQDIPVIPGCSTVSEMGAAYRQGLRYLKFFPANQLGGPQALAQVGEIYPDARFIPTGGLTFAEAKQYFHCPQVAAVGGIFMMPEEAVRGHDWAEVRRWCERTVSASIGMELAWWDNDGTGEIGMTVCSLERTLAFLRRKGIGEIEIRTDERGVMSELGYQMGEPGCRLRIVQETA